MSGTTGYDFLNRVGGLFIDPAGEKPLTDFYAEWTGQPAGYAAILREKKLLILREVLVAEVNRLLLLLQEAAGRDGRAAPASAAQRVISEKLRGRHPILTRRSAGIARAMSNNADMAAGLCAKSMSILKPSRS